MNLLRNLFRKRQPVVSNSHRPLAIATPTASVEAVNKPGTKPDVKDLEKKGEVLKLINALHYSSGDRLIDEDIKGKIIDALGNLKDPRAVDPLMEIVKDAGLPNYLNIWAVRALAKIKDPRALEPIIGRLDVNDWFYIVPSLMDLGWKPSNKVEQIYYSIIAEQWDELAATGSPAVEPLISALSKIDSNESKCRLCETLGKIGDRKALSPLYELLKTRLRFDCKAAEAGLMYFDINIASRLGNRTAVMDLLNKGVDVNVKDSDGETALGIASQEGHLEIVRLLLDEGADPNAKGQYYKTPLTSAAYEGHLEIVKLLLDRKAEIGLKGENESTALAMAARKGRLDIVQLLIDRGADVNAKDKYGNTVLMHAAGDGHLDIIKFLLIRGARLEEANDRKNDALILAANSDHLEVVKFLIDIYKGKDSLVSIGKAMNVAESNGYMAVAEFLRAKLKEHGDGTDFKALYISELFHDLQHGDMMVAINAGSSLASLQEYSAIEQAIQAVGDTGMLQRLHSLKASGNWKDSDGGLLMLELTKRILLIRGFSV